MADSIAAQGGLAPEPEGVSVDDVQPTVEASTSDEGEAGVPGAPGCAHTSCRVTFEAKVRSWLSM
jgi:hypothetical protein